MKRKSKFSYIFLTYFTRSGLRYTFGNIIKITYICFFYDNVILTTRHCKCCNCIANLQVWRHKSLFCCCVVLFFFLSFLFRPLLPMHLKCWRLLWYTHWYTHTHTHTRACAHTHTHTRARAHKHTHTHAHTHTRARTHTHTHTHTHTYSVGPFCARVPPLATHNIH
jgi:hypothetical protein